MVRRLAAGRFLLASNHSRIAAISSSAASLFGRDMVEAKHHQRVGVGEHALVDRQLVAGLIDALEDGNRMAGRSPAIFWKLRVER